MLGALLEAVAGLIEHAGELLPFAMDRPRRLPRDGALLIARTEILLTGRDLRSEDAAEGFGFIIPPRSVVRVVRFGESHELWLRPLDDALLTQLPAHQQRSASLYGYVLEMPPGAWTASFNVLEAAT